MKSAIVVELDSQDVGNALVATARAEMKNTKLPGGSSITYYSNGLPIEVDRVVIKFGSKDVGSVPPPSPVPEAKPFVSVEGKASLRHSCDFPNPS